MKYYQTYIKPIITYGLLVYGCTSRHQLNPIYICQKQVLRLFHFKPQFHPSRELFFQNGFLNVFELYTLELFKFCLKLVREENCSYFLNSFYKTRFNIHETRSVSSGAFYHLRNSNLREEQSIKNRGSKVLNYFIANHYSIDNILQWSENQLMHKVREAKNRSCPETLAELIFRSLRNQTNKCFYIALELSGPLSKKLKPYRGSSICAYAGYFSFQVYMSFKMRMWKIKSFFLSFFRHLNNLTSIEHFIVGKSEMTFSTEKNKRPYSFFPSRYCKTRILMFSGLLEPVHSCLNKVPRIENQIWNCGLAIAESLWAGSGVKSTS